MRKTEERQGVSLLRRVSLRQDEAPDGEPRWYADVVSSGNGLCYRGGV